VSETIRRYRFPTTPSLNGFRMEASDGGAWVRHEDHAAALARLTRELAEARGRENHALARLDAARAELAEARAEVARLREAGKQFTDDARGAIATFRRALGGEA
jgi:chromosome segregation ATPase